VLVAVVNVAGKSNDKGKRANTLAALSVVANYDLDLVRIERKHTHEPVSNNDPFVVPS
jgi:hypothetical protein